MHYDGVQLDRFASPAQRRFANGNDEYCYQIRT